MYNNVVTSVQISDGYTNDFPIRVGLHQGSTLNPYLFASMMDRVKGTYKGISLGVCFFVSAC
jgi:hypothetical protein